MRWSAPFSPRASGLASASLPLPPLVAPNPSLVPKTPVAVAVLRGPRRLPASMRTRRRMGLRAHPEGKRVAATPPSPRHLALGSRYLALCKPVTLSGSGALRKSRPGYAPPSAAPGRVCGKDGSSVLSGLGGGPEPSRVPGTISSSGRRRDTGRGVPLCVQVRAGEAGGGAAAPRAHSRGPSPRPCAARGRGLVRARCPPPEGSLAAPPPCRRWAAGGGAGAGPERWGRALRVPRAGPPGPLCK